ncbi:MAG: GNAT family N-acetyltransferase [Anaerolineaceae bacterium]|nr:GNAT family N-acetyltransferase [Anaerolineaceae bacterium]
MIELTTQIRQLEEAGMTALPALSTLYCDGWVLRFAGGHTNRANSVNPLYPSHLPLDEKIARCEALYRAQNLPVVFKMTQAAIPGELDARLTQRGYEALPPTSVQVADFRQLDLPESASVTLRETCSAEWLDAYARMNEVPSHRRDLLGSMLAALITPAAYASIEQNGEMIAVGLAVESHGFVGLFDIVTVAHARRRGFGRNIVASLLRWGQQHGGQQAYLQVVAANTPAVQLYANLGFHELYHYWYRRKV